jgi:Flp pilus assembly protein protease CpaA
LAAGALVVLGILLAVLGLFVGSNILLVIIGLVSILAGGILQILMTRRA